MRGLLTHKGFERFSDCRRFRAARHTRAEIEGQVRVRGRSASGRVGAATTGVLPLVFWHPVALGFWSQFSPPALQPASATPTTAVTHIAIQEKLDGKVVDWLEHVADDQYHRHN